jgi:hypothetical protein
VLSDERYIESVLSLEVMLSKEVKVAADLEIKPAPPCASKESPGPNPTPLKETLARNPDTSATLILQFEVVPMTLPGDVLKKPVEVKVKPVDPGPQDRGAQIHAELVLVR